MRCHCWCSATHAAIGKQCDKYLFALHFFFPRQVTRHFSQSISSIYFLFCRCVSLNESKFAHFHETLTVTNFLTFFSSLLVFRIWYMLRQNYIVGNIKRLEMSKHEAKKNQNLNVPLTIAFERKEHQLFINVWTIDVNRKTNPLWWISKAPWNLIFLRKQISITSKRIILVVKIFYTYFTFLFPNLFSL